jgi:Cu-processing system permease protein
MTAVALVLRAGVRDLTRSRWLLIYTIGLWVVTEALFIFGGTGEQVVLSLLNVTLLLVPLVALVFGTAHVHASREFTELLLAQPLARRSVFLGLYLGIALPLSGAFLAGIALPMLLHGRGSGAPLPALLLLAVAGTTLSLAFVALAMLIALGVDDRLRAMARALGAWVALTILYDGAVLTLVSLLGDAPLERPVLLLMLGNPVDLARVLVLSSLDVTALLGYTGALFRRLFGSSLGPAIALLALIAWAVVPVLLARRRFLRRDF